jgi:zinc transporter, ZIP family
VSLDLFSDGIKIGTATALNPSLGLLLAVGQVPADVSEGFAAIATLRRAGIRRRSRILMAGSRAPSSILLGATIGYFACAMLRRITLSILARTGGALTIVVVEEMITEAHETQTSEMEPIFLTAGFALIFV